MAGRSALLSKISAESIIKKPARPRNGDTSRRETDRRESVRFEQRLGEILEHATNVFYDKGYDAASMRDLSRASGTSLAGLYYYFESKERLLYLIQKHTFQTVIRHLRERLEAVSDPEERVRLFIQNHLEYFLANRKAMTVLSHEDETLKKGFGEEIATIKREYYKIGVQLIEALREATPGKFADVKSRIAVLSLFGMVNWIYTWHNPRIDADAADMARQMSQIFLSGVLNGAAPNGGRKARPGTKKLST